MGFLSRRDSAAPSFAPPALPPDPESVAFVLDKPVQKRISLIKALIAANSALDIKTANDLLLSAKRGPVELGCYTEPVARELHRELVQAGAVFSFARHDGSPVPPPDHPVAAVGNLKAYADRILTPEGIEHPISTSTTVAVDAAGSIAATRGRNLASKATAGLLTMGAGGIGVLFVGNAKNHVIDGRELYLTIEDPAWHYTIAMHPDLGLQARNFAAAVRSAAAALGTNGKAQPTSSPLEQLERLADLRDRGALTEEEFAEQKRRLLDS